MGKFSIFFLFCVFGTFLIKVMKNNFVLFVIQEEQETTKEHCKAHYSYSGNNIVSIYGINNLHKQKVWTDAESGITAKHHHRKNFFFSTFFISFFNFDIFLSLSILLWLSLNSEYFLLSLGVENMPKKKKKISSQNEGCHELKQCIFCSTYS